MSFMGGWRDAITSKINSNTARPGPGPVTDEERLKEDRVHVSLSNNGTGNTFVIDEEEDEDDGLGPREDVDPQKIGISRTDQERAQALALHMMAGLKKGDLISISREALPGAVLFPAIKYKDSKPEAGGQMKEKDGSATENTPNTDTNMPASSPSMPAPASEDGLKCDDTPPLDASDPTLAPNSQPTSPSQEQVHRFLVVTRERFIVLDSGGSGIGSKATVKSNHHLTELLKMTFRKSDPELICLFLGAEGKIRQYRVSKRKEFVESLQKNMQRFK